MPSSILERLRRNTNIAYPVILLCGPDWEIPETLGKCLGRPITTPIQVVITAPDESIPPEDCLIWQGAEDPLTEDLLRVLLACDAVCLFYRSTPASLSVVLSLLQLMEPFAVFVQCFQTDRMLVPPADQTVIDQLRGKPRPSGRGRIARTP